MRSFSLSVIVAKSIVAITGIGLIAFVILHLLGNLTIFFGSSVLNSYALHLHQLGPLLWIMRFSLLIIVGLHIGMVFWLWRRTLKVRHAYAVAARLEKTVYTSYMRFSGLVIVAFVLFHLSHFTWKLFHPEYALWLTSSGGPDVYRMVVTAFQNLWVTLFYLFSVALLAVHLNHGIGSLFQTLGLAPYDHPHFFSWLSRCLGWGIFCGYASIPMASFFHILPLMQ